jgi:hypothetical protein
MEDPMKTLLIAASAALLLTTSAYAGDLSFPSDDPVATITTPDGWTSKETDSGMEVMSPDEAIYLSVDVADAKDTETVVKEAVEWLGGQGVTVDDKSAKTTEDTLNGMPLYAIDWDGTDKDGPVSVSLAAVTISAETNLILSYWGTKGEQEKYGADLLGIVRSIKPVE